MSQLSAAEREVGLSVTVFYLDVGLWKKALIWSVAKICTKTATESSFRNTMKRRTMQCNNV